MLFSLFSIFVTILWIVIGTSKVKLHPFLVLLSASFLLAILLGIKPIEMIILIQKGFGNIIQNIGLLILFGTIIGIALEESNGTLSIAQGILKRLTRLPLAYAISCIGYLVSIPVFCDAAFVILSHLNKTLSKKTKTPLVGLTVALSTGLFAPHVLVPPTPGPLAAASNLQLENILLLIFMGGIIAFVLIIVGGAYGNYLIKKNKYTFEDGEEGQSKNEKISDVPSFTLAILPILIPIILMGAGTLIKFLPPDFIIIDLLNLITQPTFALGIGMLFAFRLFINNNKTNINKSIKKGIIQAAPILIITGMGGSLGSIIQTIPLHDFAKDISSYQSLGILIPFGIAALLKTAQGSSTVAIITTSSIVFPLLPLLNLDSEIGKVWVIMSLGVGSMTVSHANDSYFWIVSQMSGMDVKTAYKTHTIGTLLQGVIGFIIVFTGYSLWMVF